MANSMRNTQELTTEDVKRFLIQPLEAQSVVLSQGPSIIDSPTGDPVRIPRLTGRGNAPGWYAENVQISDADTDFDEVVLLPTGLMSLKTLSKFSNELARHSVVPIGSLVQSSLVKQVSDKLDTAFLVGAGTTTAGNSEVKGLLNQAGIQSAPALVTTSGANLVDSAIAAIGKLLTAEIRDFSKVTLFTSIADYIAIQKVKGTDGRPLLVPDAQQANVFRLQGIRVVPTSKLSAGTQLLVDFNQVVVARDLTPSVKILDQTFGDYDQLAVRVAARLDIGLFHPEGVVKLNGTGA